MLFSEPTFLFFFLPPLLGCHALCPAGWRNGLLLSASLLFYSWGSVAHLLLLCGSILTNYLLGLKISSSEEAHVRRRFLLLGLTANLCFLGWFKYAAFLLTSAMPLLELLGSQPPELPVLSLPLGISFFTFQAISYLVDVYRGQVEAQRNLTRLALYISLFPQLIAGPIVRYPQIAGQIAERAVSLAGFTDGIRRFVIGLGKKVLIANTMATSADQVFSLQADELTMLLAWIGVLSYTLQIYFDFSGYSDMAIGLAAMFGFRLPENFRHPYTAMSITDFWRRWHISLSTWFRDYVYIPLGGNRVRRSRTMLNLVAVFALCGMWHGASWNFLVWGIFHGAFLVMERASVFSRPLPRPLATSYTLLVVMIGWVIFRTESMGDACHFLRVMFGLTESGEFLGSVSTIARNDVIIAGLVGCVAATPVLSWSRNITAGLISRTERRHRLTRLTVAQGLGDLLLLGVLVLAVIWTSSHTYIPFIYFRF